MREGLPIGVLAVTRSTARPFTEKQIELVKTFADQAVIAIENVRLFDEVQKRTDDLSEALEQQTATSEVLKVIAVRQVSLSPYSRPCWRTRRVSVKPIAACCSGWTAMSFVRLRWLACHQPTLMTCSTNQDASTHKQDLGA